MKYLHSWKTLHSANHALKIASYEKNKIVADLAKSVQLGNYKQKQ